MKLQTLKGFRDFLPQEARKRQHVIDVLKKVFESYGFEPLETPALEYEEVLLGKYGDEGDKLMYRFEDNGGRRVALRYDQTVPLARVVAQYQSSLPSPFKRYQIQNVYRAENTQKGRYREFLQCDIDTVGTGSFVADVETIAIIIDSFAKLGFKNFKVLINDRNSLKFSNDGIELSPDKNILAVRAIDKIKKIGKDGVLKELADSGFSAEESEEILKTVENTKPTEWLENIFASLKSMGIDEKYYEFSPTLARGLDYYTSTILEVEAEEYAAGSLGGGGRYDNLIGTLGGTQTPAIGFAFGFDRLVEAMEELGLFPTNLSTTKVLVTIFSKELSDNSIKAANELRSQNVNTELWLDPESKLDKQLKYASAKNIPFVVIIGPEEVKNGTVTLRNMQSGEQEAIKNEDLLPTIKS